MSNFTSISDEVFEYAEKQGLEIISTGGGFDYVIRTVEVEREKGKYYIDMILTMAEHADSSPETLKEPAKVIQFFTDEDHQWYNGVELQFKTAKKAIKFMKNSNPTIVESDPTSWWGDVTQ